jgi:transcriptional regulator with XRE-family HTH domain
VATPTVRKLQLGNELRRLREAAGRTPAEAAKIIDCNVTKISRLETAQSGIALGDLKLLLEFYGDEPEHIEWMIALSRGNTERGRWAGHRAVVPTWFRSYLDLERDAEDIRLTEVEVVPGLLQTKAYAQSIMQAKSMRGDTADPDAAVLARLERQEILNRDDPARVSAILSESCVRRMIGGPTVMAEQIRHLIELSERPHLQIQLRPFDDGPDVGALVHRFVMMRVPSPGGSPPLEFVYCEDLEDARYVDDPKVVRIYNSVWGALQAAALSPSATRRMLAAIAQQLEGAQG